jgi:hypothetical protein
MNSPALKGACLMGDCRDDRHKKPRPLDGALVCEQGGKNYFLVAGFLAFAGAAATGAGAALRAVR